MNPKRKKNLRKPSKTRVKGHDILHTTSARTDTTERKQREEALRSSEIRYKELAESISDVFFAMDSDLRYTYWNKASETLTGISAKDALGKSIFDIFPDTEDTRRAVATYREVLKTRQHKSFINEYRLGDKNFVFEISVYPAEDGISIFTKDVTERTRAEEKIKDLARYPLENPNPVLRVSKDGLILHANPASEALLQSWGCKVGEEAPKYWRDILAEVFASQSARNVDVELGEEVILFTITPAKDTGYINLYGRDITDRKRMEEELGRSEERFRSLVENTSDWIWETDANGIYTYSSPKVKDLLGYDPKGVIGKTPFDFMPPEEARRVGAKFADLVKNKEPFSGLENINLHKDGREVVLETSAVPILDSNGKLLGYRGIDRDVTDRKRMETELKRHTQHIEELVETRTGQLKESEEKFRHIYNASLDAIYTTSIDGEILDMNPAGVAMFGFDSLDELKKVNIESLYVNLDDRKRLIELAGKGPVRDFRVQFKRKDGTVIDCITNSYPLSDERGRIVGLQGAIIDVSEHQEFQKKLKESEERFRGFVERSFDMIVMLDLEGRISYASPSVMWVTSYTPEEMVGQHFRNYLPKDVIPEEIRAFVEIAKGGVARAVQLRIVRKDGSLAHIEVNASPIIRNGKIAGVQAIIRDVSERFKLMEMRDRFISTVTHELRTPLVSITGYLDLAVSGALGAVPKEIESSLLVVKRNTDRLLNLTNDLLDFRRLEAGKFELNKAPLNFQDVIKNCVEDTQPSIDEKKQILNLEVSEGPLPIQGDAVRLSQVLVNLLSNANKFAPESSTITLRATEEEDVIQVQVSDKGIGIKKEDLGRIFEPFAAIEKPSHVKGTGLGLSVSKGLIEAHGGKIWAESPGEEKGATFTFTLPKRKGTD